MDQDGANHRFLTNGQSIVLTPRFAPNQQQIVYMAFTDNRPRIYTYNVGSGQQRLVVDAPNMTLRAALLARRPARSSIRCRSAATRTSTACSASGGTPTRLTNAPGINTAPCYSPDGSKIVFESDRSGAPAALRDERRRIGNQHRISFGGGRYATPVWSPRGDLIAFTKIGGGFARRRDGARRIGREDR